MRVHCRQGGARGSEGDRGLGQGGAAPRCCRGGCDGSKAGHARCVCGCRLIYRSEIGVKTRSKRRVCLSPLVQLEEVATQTLGMHAFPAHFAANQAASHSSNYSGRTSSVASTSASASSSSPGGYAVYTSPTAASKRISTNPLNSFTQSIASSLPSVPSLPSTSEKVVLPTPPVPILDRNLAKTRGSEVATAAWAFLFSEIIQYTQRRVAGIAEFEERWGMPCRYCLAYKLMHIWLVDCRRLGIESGKGSLSFFHYETPCLPLLRVMHKPHLDRPVYFQSCTMSTLHCSNTSLVGLRLVWRRVQRMKMNTWWEMMNLYWTKG